MKSIRNQTELIAESIEILSKYKRDEAEFTGFNAIRFTPTFKADFQQAINDCMNFNDDETMVDIQTEKTADIETVMEKARKNYARIKYFVEEAFPENERRRNLLGADTYSDARKSVPNMIVFLSNLHRQCTVFQPALVAAGCSAPLIADILTLRNDLIAVNTEQTSFIGERSISTQERNTRFDRLEDYIRAVCRAGKLIFEENPAIFKQYLRFTGKSTSNTTTVQTEKITISANGDGVLLSKKIKNTDFIEVENTGNGNVDIYIADAIQNPVPKNALTLFSNQKAVLTVNDFIDNGIKSVIAHNTVPQEGSIQATILNVLDDSGN